MQVFAKLAYDYLGNEDIDWFNFHKEKQDELDQSAEWDPYTKRFKLPGSDVWEDMTNAYEQMGGATQRATDSLKSLPQTQQDGEAINQEQTFTPNTKDFQPTDTSAQPDDPRMLDIARDWSSDEYRWSYDGHQLHMWRVFNRSAYGPSHYDMFGTEGYDNHSQGRV